LTELDQPTQRAQAVRIEELESEVARFKSIEHGLELAAAHAQRVASRLQSILNTTVDAIITIDEQGVIQTANPATERMFGYNQSELVGQDVTQLLPEFAPPTHHSNVGADAKGRPDAIMGIGRTPAAKRKDGSFFPVDLSISEAEIEGRRVFTGIIRDVTERTRANELLSESEARFRLFFESAPMGIAVSSGDAPISQVNPALLGMLSCAEDYLIGKRLLDLSPPGEERLPADTLLRLAAGEGPTIGFTRALARGDGTVMWAHVTATGIRGDEGELLYVVRMIEDVTARHEAESNLLASENRFRSLVEAAPIGIALYSSGRSMVSANPALQALLGYGEKEFVGYQLDRFWHPAFEQGQAGTHQRLTEGGEQRTSYTRVLKHRDGTPVWTQITAAAITGDDGKLAGIVRLVQDITAVRHAEIDRREREDLLSAIIDNAPLGIALATPDRDIITVNPAAESILGYPAAEIVGKHLGAFVDASDSVTHLNDRFADGAVTFDQQERNLRKSDGTRIAAQITNSVVRRKDGSIQYFVRMLDDITQRRDTKRELEDSEARFRALFEAAPVGLLIKDIENRIVSTNSLTQQLFGRTNDELCGTRIKDYWAPGFTQDNPGQPERLVNREIDSYDATAPLTKSDGTIFWIQGRQSAVRDADGQFLYAIQSLDDVTDRREAAQTLKSSEERFRQLFESSPLGVAVYGPDRRIERVNPSLMEMLGRPEQELIGHRLPEFFAPGYDPGTPSSGDRIDNGDLTPQSFERNFTRSDGSPIWAKVTSTAFRDESDHQIRVMRTLEDITADKQAATLLQESESRFRSLFDSTPVGIALVADDVTITAVNPALERLLGYTADEITGKTLSSFRSPNDPGQGRHRTLALSTTHSSGVTSERLHLKKDGGEVWTQVVTAPVRDEQGVFQFGVRMIVDISERKQIERLKDEFLGMVNHELRTPLTAIEAGVGLVASGALGSLPDKVQHMLNIAAENSGRLTRLVNDVLDLERMSAGRVELQSVQCQASDLIDQAAHAAGALADEAGVTLETTSADIRLMADPDRIVQTLINLIANAVKFSPAGSAVSLGVAKTAKGARFQVVDHGRGIPPDQINLVFDRFHQVETGDSRNQGGTGLGLAISQWIVEQHGGSIWAESVVEKGSTFFFELPQA
jgi:PAS domain S-box-containing protein